jgi:hypothetical protein
MFHSERGIRLRLWCSRQLVPFARWYLLPAAVLVGAIVATANGT